MRAHDIKLDQDIHELCVPCRLPDGLQRSGACRGALHEDHVAQTRPASYTIRFIDEITGVTYGVDSPWQGQRAQPVQWHELTLDMKVNDPGDSVSQK